MKKLLSIILGIALICGCSVSRHSTSQKFSSLDKYQYFIVMETSQLTSSSGAVFGTNGVVYCGSSTKSVNPSDIISGYLMKRGMVRLPAIDDNKADKTLIIAYGESGRHAEFMGHSVEITLQLLDGVTKDVVATSTAAGIGETQADDIRKAINRALKNIFE